MTVLRRRDAGQSALLLSRIGGDSGAGVAVEGVLEGGREQFLDVRCPDRPLQAGAKADAPDGAQVERDLIAARRKLVRAVAMPGLAVTALDRQLIDDPVRHQREPGLTKQLLHARGAREGN